MVSVPAELDQRDTLAALEEVVRLRRRCEVDDLELVLHWADLHSADLAYSADLPWAHPVERSVGRRVGPGFERLDDLGGAGTPGVHELSLCELGIARGVHTLAARAVTADALDLRHRLPHVFDHVRELSAEVWLARKIAAMTRHLSYDAAGLVDRAVAAAISGQAPSRVIALCEAKIIEADRAAHEARVAEALRKRFVGLSRIDDTGLQHVIARVTAGAGRDVDQKIDQVADALAARPEHKGDGRDELRAEAFGWLARPEELAALLAGQAGPRKHQRGAVLYIHLHQATLEASAGVARVEGLGPHTMTQLRDLVGHRHVTVRPVIDLHDRISVNAYEHPQTIAERIHLAQPGDAFPHAARISRNVDLDHLIPFDVRGPAGQTNSHDSQPLSRTGHRAKTHLAYTTTRTDTGEVLWRTPYGRHRIVDHTGTRIIDQSEAEAWTSEDPLDRALTRIRHQHLTDQLPFPVS